MSWLVIVLLFIVIFIAIVLIEAAVVMLLVGYLAPTLVYWDWVRICLAVSVVIGAGVQSSR